MFVDLAHSEHEETEMLAVLHMQMSSVLNQVLAHLSENKKMTSFYPLKKACNSRYSNYSFEFCPLHAAHA